MFVQIYFIYDDPAKMKIGLYIVLLLNISFINDLAMQKIDFSGICFSQTFKIKLIWVSKSMKHIFHKILWLISHYMKVIFYFLEECNMTP